MSEPARRTLTYPQWHAEGTRRFGCDLLQWRFVCPSCGHVATPAQWKAVGAAAGEVAFSCIGRHTPGAGSIFSGKSPCNYAGGGLVRLNPVTVVQIDTGGAAHYHEIFEFEGQHEIRP